MAINVLIDKGILSYPDAQLAAFSIDISNNIQPQDGAAASLWHAKTLELSRTNHKSYDNN